MKKKSGAQVALVLGVVIVLLGGILLAVGCNQFANMETASSDFSSSHEYASSYTFGADFYTEMYGVTYDALNQLNNFSSNTASNFSQLNNHMVQSMGALYSAACWLIVALGLGLCGIACIKLNRVPAENADEKSALMKKSLEVNERLLAALDKLSAKEVAVETDAAEEAVQTEAPAETDVDAEESASTLDA